MCGRAKLTTSPEILRELFQLRDLPDLGPHYNIAPTQPIAVIRHPGELEQLRFGLVPGFAASPREVGARFLNARAETVQKLNVFREAFARRRCLVVVDAFYEWKREGKTKQPYIFRRSDEAPFAIGGVWERWASRATGEVIESVAVITAAAREPIAAIHDRMPLVLAPARYAAWLDPETPAPESMLEPAELPLEASAVSLAVNNPRNDGPECVMPAEG